MGTGTAPFRASASGTAPATGRGPGQRGGSSAPRARTWAKRLLRRESTGACADASLGLTFTGSSDDELTQFVPPFRGTPRDLGTKWTPFTFDSVSVADAVGGSLNTIQAFPSILPRPTEAEKPETRVPGPPAAGRRSSSLHGSETLLRGRDAQAGPTAGAGDGVRTFRFLWVSSGGIP